MKFLLPAFVLFTFLLTSCIFDTDPKPKPGTDSQTGTEATTTPATEPHIVVDTPGAKESQGKDSIVLPSQRDSDKDGINDDVDKCPSEKGPASNKGCPVISTVTPLPAIDTIAVH
ncbi:MAG: hypothetical protein JNN00_10445 [Chitinophagaceae bacterium]|nr:hypothetical protein [Chitinophagaceae bacterium]